MDFLPSYEFQKCVDRYHGQYKVKSFSCWEQFLCLALAQLTYRESHKRPVNHIFISLSWPVRISHCYQSPQPRRSNGKTKPTRSTKGGLIVIGSLNLGGSLEMIPNPVAVAELAVEKGAAQILMPISTRKQLLDLPDEMATKVNIVFYADPADALMKAMLE